MPQKSKKRCFTVAIRTDGISPPLTKNYCTGIYVDSPHTPRAWWKGDIACFCDRTGRILREDIKVCTFYIRKHSRAEPEK